MMSDNAWRSSGTGSSASFFFFVFFFSFFYFVLFRPLRSFFGRRGTAAILARLATGAKRFRSDDDDSERALDEPQSASTIVITPSTTVTVDPHSFSSEDQCHGDTPTHRHAALRQRPVTGTVRLTRQRTTAAALLSLRCTALRRSPLDCHSSLFHPIRLADRCAPPLMNDTAATTTSTTLRRPSRRRRLPALRAGTARRTRGWPQRNAAQRNADATGNGARGQPVQCDGPHNETGANRVALAERDARALRGVTVVSWSALRCRPLSGTHSLVSPLPATAAAPRSLPPRAAMMLLSTARPIMGMFFSLVVSGLAHASQPSTRTHAAAVSLLCPDCLADTWMDRCLCVRVHLCGCVCD